MEVLPWQPEKGKSSWAFISISVGSLGCESKDTFTVFVAVCTPLQCRSAKLSLNGCNLWQ